jgi:DnaJ-class molecular chaperone
MAQGPNSKDPYAQLGVKRNADADAIKKAYRALAQKYHPDRNESDPAAEERFKEISAANAVLSDEKRRKDYDDFGEVALDPNFDGDKARQAGHGFGGGGGFRQQAGGAGYQDMGGFGSLFEDLFRGGGQAQPRQQRGADLETEIVLDFVDAVRGCERRITLDGGGTSQNLTVRIPPGVDEGAKIRLAGKGRPGHAGGPPGDLFARVKIRPHAFFKRNDKNLSLEVPISFLEALKGATIEVPTITGKVNLRIPPGTDSGARLRLRGKGVPGRAGAQDGDLHVSIQIRVPKDLDDDAIESVEKALKEVVEEDPKAWRKDALPEA